MKVFTVISEDGYLHLVSFLCANVYDFDFSSERKFDLILMLGLLHHLNDAGASRLLAQAQQLLDTTGRLVTLDACRTEGQGRFEKWLVDMDRGEHVRRVDAYLHMADSIFPNVTSYFCTNLLRYSYTPVSYTHLTLPTKA